MGIPWQDQPTAADYASADAQRANQKVNDLEIRLDTIEIGLREMAHAALLALPGDVRTEVMAEFCYGCGRDDPRCQCENDE